MRKMGWFLLNPWVLSLIVIPPCSFALILFGKTTTGERIGLGVASLMCVAMLALGIWVEFIYDNPSSPGRNFDPGWP